MRTRRGANATGLRGAVAALCASFCGVVVMLAGVGFMLMPAAPAGANPPAQGWTSTQAPLPPDHGTVGSLPQTYLASSACPAANACTMVGWYNDTADHAWGLIEQQNGTSWTDTEAPQPNDAGTSTKQGLWIGSDACGYSLPCRALACPTTTFCVAVGNYNDSGGANGYKQPLIETMSNGSWSANRAPLPLDAATDSGPVFPDALLYAVSCTSATSCVAVGQYRNTGGVYIPLAVTLSGTTWSASIAPLPPGVLATSGNSPPLLNSVACPVSGFCMAVGQYRAAGGELTAFIDGVSNGTWTPINAPQPSDQGSGVDENSMLSQVVCTSGTACTAVGLYSDTGGISHSLIDTWNGATWTPIRPPEPAGTLNAQLVAVSCATPTFCAAVGQWYDGSKYRGLVESLSGSTWTGANAPLPTVVPTANQYGFLWEVTCPTAAFCLAAGQYRNENGNDAATALTYSAGAWSAAVAPIPTPLNGSAIGRTVACDSPVACVLGGQYYDPGNHQQGFLDTWTGAQGYWLDATDGGVFAFPNNGFFGSTGNLVLNKPMVGMSATPDGQGYWLAASDGGVFNFGDATFQGSAGNLHLNKPVVGMASTPTGNGYWLVATDGGIFTYGDAQFYGSTGNLHLNAPIVGMASTPDGGGYWLVAADGGIFNYGDANFYGSAGNLHLNKPVVGMASTATGLGYWLVASDGGIFNYGDAQFYGSTGNLTLNKPVVGMASSPSGMGYWLVASDGGIFNYGDAPFEGSTGNLTLNKPIVGMAAG